MLILSVQERSHRGGAEERVFDYKILRTLRSLCLCGEIRIGALVAAQPRCVSVVNTSSQETQKNLNLRVGSPQGAFFRSGQITRKQGGNHRIGL